MITDKEQAEKKISNLETKLAMLDGNELETYKSFVSVGSDKTSAVLAYLNNFYFRAPGGWYTSEMREYFADQELLFSDIKKAMIDSGLTEEDCVKLEKMTSKEQREYVFNDSKYQMVPILLEAYVTLRENYDRQILIR